MAPATLAARERLVAFHATNPTPEKCQTPAYAELKAAAEFEDEVALHTDPDAMRAKADSLDEDAARYDASAKDWETGAASRSAFGNEDVARQWAANGRVSRQMAVKARHKANVLRAAAARLLQCEAA